MTQEDLDEINNSFYEAINASHKSWLEKKLTEIGGYPEPKVYGGALAGGMSIIDFNKDVT